MSDAYTGGCACGAVRYEISAEPIFMNDCQCRDCQRTSGTGHGSYLTFPSRAQVKVAGEATHWDMVGDSGNVKTRAFCPDLRVAGLPDVRGHARSVHRARREPRRSEPVRAASGDLRRARPRLGPPRSGPAEIRDDAAGVRGGPTALGPASLCGAPYQVALMPVSICNLADERRSRACPSLPLIRD